MKKGCFSFLFFYFVYFVSFVSFLFFFSFVFLFLSQNFEPTRNGFATGTASTTGRN
jgi:hypothetical protein